MRGVQGLRSVTHKLPHFVRAGPALAEAGYLIPGCIFDLILPLGENLVVKDLGVPAGLVGDLLNAPEHEELADGQGWRLEFVRQERWEPAAVPVVISHVIQRLAIAGQVKRGCSHCR